MSLLPPLNGFEGITPEEVQRALEKARRVWISLVAEEPSAAGLEPLMAAIVQEMAIVLDKQTLVAQPSEIARCALRAAQRCKLLAHPGIYEAVRRALITLYR